MPSNRFLRIADRIVKEDKAIFDALLEFEKNRKDTNQNQAEFHNRQGDC